MRQTQDNKPRRNKTIKKTNVRTKTRKLIENPERKSSKRNYQVTET